MYAERKSGGFVSRLYMRIKVRRRIEGLSRSHCMWLRQLIKPASGGQFDMANHSMQVRMYLATTRIGSSVTLKHGRKYRIMLMRDIEHQ